MSRRLSIALCFILAAGTQSLPVPRPAAPLTIDFPDGRKQPLSAYRGKVVALCFIHTTCPHCQELSGEMGRLYAQYGAQGFQPLLIAWNDGAKVLLPDFVKTYHVTFPAGYSDRQKVLAYLGISVMDTRLVVPQMLWIDRKGVVRAQTPSVGDENMLTDAYFRKTIANLLAEPAATPTSTRRIPKAATPAKQ